MEAVRGTLNSVAEISGSTRCAVTAAMREQKRWVIARCTLDKCAMAKRRYISERMTHVKTWSTTAWKQHVAPPPQRQVTGSVAGGDALGVGTGLPKLKALRVAAAGDNIGVFDISMPSLSPRALDSRISSSDSLFDPSNTPLITICTSRRLSWTRKDTT